MDSLISAAARALAGGDPLRALNHVSLRDDAPALALRGIAMAQLGDLARARALLRRAARAFTTKETVARTLAEAWPGDARRDTLIERAFRLRQVEESHRARLRVEIGRLRKALRPLARLHATRHGFKLEPLTGDVAVLARPVEDKHAPILAFLSDGEAWSSSALALALGTSQRTVQRALDALANAGKVEAIGQGRARRWVASPVLGFTTTLLLTAPLPGG
ncbi:MAG: helix-turn-helix domain-containing protein [Alloalcanivorax venustensis]|jgi:DNA-binding transcriptional ArsR family regulator|uniref:helix-turn-helix domain-containing protein n=1 Tax=Alloalcanivorax venustensis TaxID=172371 RepID=UPI0030039CBE